MRIIFSDHARAQMNERNLTQDAILRAVENPDKVVKQGGNRFAAQKLIRRNGKRYVLIVVYDEIGDAREIVTSFLTTKFKKYL